jgi:hypothetical protein
MNAPRPAALLLLRSLIVTLAWGGAVASVQAAPVVSNLTAAQRAGTKLVDISYDLAAPGFGSVAVTLEASSDGGATWTAPVASATGAVGESVTPGTGKAIVWNAGVDWLGNSSTQMRFRVVVVDGTTIVENSLDLFTTRRRSALYREDTKDQIIYTRTTIQPVTVSESYHSAGSTISN